MSSSSSVPPPSDLTPQPGADKSSELKAGQSFGHDFSTDTRGTDASTFTKSHDAAETRGADLSSKEIVALKAENEKLRGAVTELTKRINPALDREKTASADAAKKEQIIAGLQAKILELGTAPPPARPPAPDTSRR